MRKVKAIATSTPYDPDGSRFWSKVDKSGDGCWLWTASGISKGYGYVRRLGLSHYAHRVAWVLTYGEVPEGLFVCHKCDTRRCCRPDHLFLGTCADNLADMALKERAYRPLGRRTARREGQSAVTNDGVRFAMELVALGYTDAHIANIMRVTQHSVRNWRVGHCRRHATGKAAA